MLSSVVLTKVFRGQNQVLEGNGLAVVLVHGDFKSQTNFCIAWLCPHSATPERLLIIIRYMAIKSSPIEVTIPWLERFT